MIELWRLADVSKAAHRYILLKIVMTNVQKMSQCRQTGWQFALMLMLLQRKTNYRFNSELRIEQFSAILACFLHRFQINHKSLHVKDSPWVLNYYLHIP